MIKTTRKEYFRKWRLEHKEQLKTYRKNWRVQNKTKTKKYWQTYAQTHRDGLKKHYLKYRSENRQKTRNAVSRYYHENKTKCQDYQLKRLYGLTLEQYNKKVEEQNGRCFICNCQPNGKAANAKLQIDHNHQTGKVRRLLCHKCNLAIGFIGENPEIATKIAEYLKIT